MALTCRICTVFLPQILAVLQSNSYSDSQSNGQFRLARQLQKCTRCHSLPRLGKYENNVFLRFKNMIDYLSIKSFQFRIFVLRFTPFLSCVWLEAHIYLANIILTFPQVTLQWPHSPRSHLQAWRTSLKGRNVTTLLIRRDKSLVNREIKIIHTI